MVEGAFAYVTEHGFDSLQRQCNTIMEVGSFTDTQDSIRQASQTILGETHAYQLLQEAMLVTLHEVSQRLQSQNLPGAYILILGATSVRFAELHGEELIGAIARLLPAMIGVELAHS